MSLSVIVRDGSGLQVIRGFNDSAQAESWLRAANHYGRALRQGGQRNDAGPLLVAETLSLDEANETLFPGGPKGWQEHESARKAAEVERKRQEAAERKRREEERQAAEREQEIRRRLILKQEREEQAQHQRWYDEIASELDSEATAKK